MKAAARHLLQGIRTKLVCAAGRKPQALAGLHGHAGEILAYGIERDHFKQIRRTWASEVRELQFDDALEVAGNLLATHVEEEGHLGVSAIRAVAGDIEPKHFKTLDTLVGNMSSWSMVDDFATGKAGLTAPLLERYPTRSLAMLRRWRRSNVPMQRRAGVVTFTRATAANGKYADEILSFCEDMQFDPEDLVQKAIGWALKDALKANAQTKRRGVALIKRMRSAGVPGTITSYAMRDLSPAEKKAIRDS